MRLADDKRVYSVYMHDFSGVSVTYVDGRQIGNSLTDNNYVDDGYRFHDVFHIAHLGVLGWSPVLTGFVEGKRASKRERSLEEGIISYVFSQGPKGDSAELAHQMQARFSVEQWRFAIELGWRLWRYIRSTGTAHWLVEEGGHITRLA